MALSIQMQLAEIEKKLQSKIEDAMKKEVADAVIEEGKIQVDNTVYKAYDPKQYERTGRLMEEWESKGVENGVIVRNIREDDITGKYIPEVIESGEGYDYSGYGYAYEEPRPFIENTKERLAKDKSHVKALGKGLERQGVKIG